MQLPQDLKDTCTNFTNEQTEVASELFEIFYQELPNKNLFSLFFNSNSAERWTDLPNPDKEKVKALIPYIFKNNSTALIKDNKNLFAAIINLARTQQEIYDLFINMNSIQQTKLIESLSAFFKTIPLLPTQISEQELISKITWSSFLIKENIICEAEHYQADNFYTFNSHRSQKESNVIKIHITLLWDDFYQHRQNLTKLLIKYVNDGAITEFKFYQSDIKEIFEGLSMQEIEDQFLPSKRYLEGDQFTIYFPKSSDPSYDIKKIIELCKSVEQYCQTHSLTPGKYTEIESPITSFLVIRQDHLDGKYIDALSKDKEVNNALKEQLEKSDIYQALISTFQLIDKPNTNTNSEKKLTL